MSQTNNTAKIAELLTSCYAEAVNQGFEGDRSEYRFYTADFDWCVQQLGYSPTHEEWHAACDQAGFEYQPITVDQADTVHAVTKALCRRLYVCVMRPFDLISRHDDRPYHAHGDWVGPCGNARHDLILAGGSADKPEATPRSAAERSAFTLKWTRLSPDGLHCACCKTLLLTDALHIESLIDTSNTL